MARSFLGGTPLFPIKKNLCSRMPREPHCTINTAHIELHNIAECIYYRYSGIHLVETFFLDQVVLFSKVFQRFKKSSFFSVIGDFNYSPTSLAPFDSSVNILDSEFLHAIQGRLSFNSNNFARRIIHHTHRIIAVSVILKFSKRFALF